MFYIGNFFFLLSDVFPLRQPVSLAAEGIGNFVFLWFPMYFLSTSLFRSLPKASEILFFLLSDVFPLHWTVWPAAEGIGNFVFCGFRCIFSSLDRLALRRRHRKICFLVVSDVFPLHQHVSPGAKDIGNSKIIRKYRMTPAKLAGVSPLRNYAFAAASFSL